MVHFTISKLYPIELIHKAEVIETMLKTNKRKIHCWANKQQKTLLCASKSNEKPLRESR